MSNFGCFEMGNRLFPYFRPNFNNISYGSQSVEIPVAMYLYSKFYGLSSKAEGKILEIGCTFPNFMPNWFVHQKERIFPHICVDGDSQTDGAIVTRFSEIDLPTNRFNYIFSINSFRRVVLPKIGETYEDNLTTMTNTIHRLLQALSKKGILLITIPWTYSSSDWREAKDIDNLIHHYKALTISSNYDENILEAPNLIFKLNRQGFGYAGNIWKEVDPYDSPDLPMEPEGVGSLAKTVYFMLWGATENW